MQYIQHIYNTEKVFKTALVFSVVILSYNLESIFVHLTCLKKEFAPKNNKVQNILTIKLARFFISPREFFSQKKLFLEMKLHI